MILEDNKIAVFRAVVRCGGVTAAARELGVSQPAVSQALAELESSLGARLLRRDKSGIELTPDGALFLSYAERSERLSAEAGALFAPGVRRQVAVAAPAHIASAMLTPLKEQYSGRIDIESVPEGTPADIAIVTRPQPGDIPVGRLSVSFNGIGGEIVASDSRPLFARESEEFKGSPLRNIIIGILGGKL